ncbi:MAG: hypothetical protein ACREX8_00825 [Gammaproteobacteria bacterium]
MLLEKPLCLVQGAGIPGADEGAAVVVVSEVVQPSWLLAVGVVPGAVETIGIRMPHRLQQGARLGLAGWIGVERVEGTAGVDDRGRDVAALGVPPSPAEPDHTRGPRVVLVLVGKLREERFDLGAAVERG